MTLSLCCFKSHHSYLNLLTFDSILHRIGSLILSQATLETQNNESVQQIKESADMVTRAALETDPKVPVCDSGLITIVQQSVSESIITVCHVK